MHRGGQHTAQLAVLLNADRPDFERTLGQFFARVALGGAGLGEPEAVDVRGLQDEAVGAALDHAQHCAAEPF
jgi:hypothetical protein